MAKTTLVRPQGKVADTRARRRRHLHQAAVALTYAVFVLTTVLMFVKGQAPDGTPRDAEATGALGGPEAHPEWAREGVQEAAMRRKQPRQEKHPAEPANAGPVSAAEQARRNALMDRLVAAYPDFLAGHGANELIWRDGTHTAFDDGRNKDFEARLDGADVEDQFANAYPAGPMLSDPEANFDPGRFRNEAFFAKMYGDCHRGEVQKQLVDVVWLPKHGARKIKMTPVNGVAGKLQAASNELDALPPEFMQYLQPIAGTFNCRDIAGTERASAHAHGIAIDLNAKFGDYWQWHKGRYSYSNRIPWEIAAIFEKHGFIWGAKWYHFDSLHFEYRPEMFSGEDASGPDEGAPVPLPEKQPRNLD